MEIVVGGSIIIPILIKVDATTISITINGKYIKKPIIEESKKEPAYKESNEEIAIWEMKQRIKALREQGLPESPD